MENLRVELDKKPYLMAYRQELATGKRSGVVKVIYQGPLSETRVARVSRELGLTVQRVAKNPAKTRFNLYIMHPAAQGGHFNISLDNCHDLVGQGSKKFRIVGTEGMPAAAREKALAFFDRLAPPTHLKLVWRK